MAGPGLTRAAGARTLVLLLALAGPGAPAVAQGGVVLAAQVGGAGIARERLDQALEELLAEKGRSAAGIRSPATYKQLRREALDRLVDEELLWQEASSKGRVASPREVEEAVARERERLGAEAFRRRLERGNLTAESHAARMRRELSIARLLEEEILAGLAVTDLEAYDFYAANPGRFTPEGGETVPEERVHDNLKGWLLLRKREAAVRDHVARLRAAAAVEILER